MSHSTTPRIGGVIPAMTTPFTRNGETVDTGAAVALAQALVDRGVDGLFPCGTTGEGLLLSLDERRDLLEAVCRAVGERVSVIAHTGCLDTRGAILLTRHARDIGAAAAAVIAPPCYRYDDDALFAHFRAVADAVPGFPVLLYNLPEFAGNPLSADFVLRLARELENIVGIKDSGGSLARVARLAAEAPRGFIVINGVDDHTCAARMAGAHGSVASMANLVPEWFRAIYDGLAQHDHERALAAQRRLSQITAVIPDSAFIGGLKAALRMRGLEAGCVRPPQREATDQERRDIEQGLRSLGLIE